MTVQRLRSASAALLLGLVLSSGAAAAASQRDALVARWVGANAAQIANVHGAKARARAQAAFDKVRAQLDVHDVTGEVPDVRAVAIRELATPGRYRLSDAFAPPPNRPWYEQVWDWLKEQIGKLWNALFGRVKVGPGGTIAIGEILLGAAVLGLLFAVIRLLAEFQMVRRSRAASVEALGAPQDARDLYERAHAAAQRRFCGGVASFLPRRSSRWICVVPFRRIAARRSASCGARCVRAKPACSRRSMPLRRRSSLAPMRSAR